MKRRYEILAFFDAFEHEFSKECAGGGSLEFDWGKLTD
jgi:hypothetical protein